MARVSEPPCLFQLLEACVCVVSQCRSGQGGVSAPGQSVSASDGDGRPEEAVDYGAL